MEKKVYVFLGRPDDLPKENVNAKEETPLGSFCQSEAERLVKDMRLEEAMAKKAKEDIAKRLSETFESWADPDVMKEIAEQAVEEMQINEQMLEDRCKGCICYRENLDGAPYCSDLEKPCRLISEDECPDFEAAPTSMKQELKWAIGWVADHSLPGEYRHVDRMIEWICMDLAKEEGK